MKEEMAATDLFVTSIGNKSQIMLKGPSILLAILLCLCSCSREGSSGRTPSGTGSVKTFAIDLDSGTVRSESGIVMKTLTRSEPQSADDGVIPDELARPDSATALRQEAVEQFSVRHPMAYDRALARGITLRASSQPREFFVDGTPISVPRETSPLAAHQQEEAWMRVAQNPVRLKVYAGSGPYHRVFTNPGYSYLQGSVYLPCEAVLRYPRSETAFAYVGGWGAGADGTAVDAGFQYSWDYKNYALFIKGVENVYQRRKQISEWPRFVCNHWVKFRFFAYSDTELRFWAKGYTADNNGKERMAGDQVEGSLRHGKGYNWPSNGGGPSSGIILKRMTTIGQSGIEKRLLPGQTWDTDGSYFGHAENSRSPLVRWSDLLIGTVDKHGKPVHLVPWGAPQTFPAADAEALDYPTAAVIVLCPLCSSEANAIDLSSTIGSIP
jgi:hypothetical protein